MVGAKEVVDLVSGAAALVRDHALPSGYWPDPTTVAAVAVVAGAVLALWGGRLLRAFYVLAFMAAGAAAGVRLARVAGVDDLIGLVLGGGLAGLTGYLFYRWWVGMTAGICAMLVVVAVAGARNLPVIQSQLQAFTDHRLGVGTGRYVPGLPELQANRGEPVPAYLAEFGAYYWDTQREAVYRIAFILGLTGLIGLGMGLILPRFTTILVTSLIGVLGLALGTGLLISTYRPGWWAVILGRVAWFLAGLGVVLIVSLAYQARHGRPVSAPPAAPAAPAM